MGDAFSPIRPTAARGPFENGTAGLHRRAGNMVRTTEPRLPPHLTRKAVELALSGDQPAPRLCIELVLPPCSERS